MRTAFGAFEFDNTTGELWRDGRRVRLQRQPSRLLELLTARPGEVVSREEIRLALWGDDTHVNWSGSKLVTDAVADALWREGYLK